MVFQYVLSSCQTYLKDVYVYARYENGTSLSTTDFVIGNPTTFASIAEIPTRNVLLVSGNLLFTPQTGLYPLDTQELELTLQAALPSNLITFVPVIDKSRLTSTITLTGWNWKSDSFNITTRDFIYPQTGVGFNQITLQVTLYRSPIVAVCICSCFQYSLPLDASVLAVLSSFDYCVCQFWNPSQRIHYKTWYCWLYTRF